MAYQTYKCIGSDMNALDMHAWQNRVHWLPSVQPKMRCNMKHGQAASMNIVNAQFILKNTNNMKTCKQ